MVSNVNDINDNMFVSDRGKVVGGLPDVVTIMEKKVWMCDWDLSLYKFVHVCQKN